MFESQAMSLKAMESQIGQIANALQAEQEAQKQSSANATLTA